MLFFLFVSIHSQYRFFNLFNNSLTTMLLTKFFNNSTALNNIKLLFNSVTCSFPFVIHFMIFFCAVLILFTIAHQPCTLSLILWNQLTSTCFTYTQLISPSIFPSISFRWFGVHDPFHSAESTLSCWQFMCSLFHCTYLFFKFAALNFDDVSLIWGGLLQY